MEIMFEFNVFSKDFPVEDVFKKIGIPEGEIIRHEETAIEMSCGEKYIREKECCITYSTGYIETYDTEIPMQMIYKMLLPKESIICECIEKYNLFSKFGVIINLSDNPIINLSRDFISMASNFHAEIEFDTYLDNNEEHYVEATHFYDSN